MVSFLLASPSYPVLRFIVSLFVLFFIPDWLFSWGFPWRSRLGSSVLSFVLIIFQCPWVIFMLQAAHVGVFPLWTWRSNSQAAGALDSASAVAPLVCVCVLAFGPERDDRELYFLFAVNS